MAVITLSNQNLVLGTPSTFVSQDAVIADIQLTVGNTTGFQADQILIIGQMGNENSEVVYVESVDDQTHLTISGYATSGLAYNHSASSPLVTRSGPN